jgi:hypothetical protein
MRRTARPAEAAADPASFLLALALVVLVAMAAMARGKAGPGRTLARPQAAQEGRAARASLSLA